MRWSPFIALLPLAQATALTAILAGNEKSCYYADVDGIGEKIGFYFAVQSGGSFDIDYVVMDPDDRVLLEGANERQGDFIFTANKLGEYSFCFENDASMSDKLLDFDIMVESEPRRTISSQQQPLKEHTSSLEESTYKLNGLFTSITRIQKYFHTRHHRNYSTVLSTQSRIFWFTLLESTVVIGMAFVQVWILKTFFAGGK
ncbi:emp24/gp25L/p24 family/GOLD-domain-containing protein [Papiliotrema laurentii]|uniref:Emp24/gp25L/p24 family/GOLD-domain-containing protein n=1 Tax=Papiliotrema laurentii TaxID=5418 RepID=A0AAD9CZQ8_PAPLA|nr:emp24/gp25L/p24 family/GOLD-domain-containing protein [Papiliotrema laurentii]